MAGEISPNITAFQELIFSKCQQPNLSVTRDNSNCRWRIKEITPSHRITRCGKEKCVLKINAKYFWIQSFLHVITVTSHEHQSVSNCRQPKCFFNSSFRFKANKILNSVLCDGNPLVAMVSSRNAMRRIYYISIYNWSVFGNFQRYHNQ